MVWEKIVKKFEELSLELFGWIGVILTLLSMIALFSSMFILTFLFVFLGILSIYLDCIIFTEGD